MSPLPIVYRSGTDTNQVFNFMDSILGGQVTLYLSTSGSSTGIGYVVTGTVTDSDTRLTSVAAFSDTWTARNSLDFDILAEKAFVLKGDAIFNFTHQINRSGGAENANARLKVLIRKWDGATETEIASAISDTITATEVGNVFAREQLIVTITEHRINKGESLRVTIEQWTQADSGDTAATYYIYHDPSNRDPVEVAESEFENSNFVAVIPLLSLET